MKEKETNNAQALSEEDLENVSGGYIIHHGGPGETFYGDPGNQIGNYEDFGKAQMLTLEEFKKLQEANK